MGVLLLEIDHPVGRLRACLVVLILNQNYFEFLTEIFKRCDKTNNTQLLGNLLNIFSQGNLRFPEGLWPEGNLKLDKPTENTFLHAAYW